MISIEVDVTDVEPLIMDSSVDYLHKDSSEEKLFIEIRNFFSRKGVRESLHSEGGGYALGRISTGGNDPDYSLFCRDGYWIVTHGERGRASLIGIFGDEHNAVNFFISKFIKPETIDWGAVFS